MILQERVDFILNILGSKSIQSKCQKFFQFNWRSKKIKMGDHQHKCFCDKLPYTLLIGLEGFLEG